MAETERKRLPALFDAFGFAVEASIHDAGLRHTLPIASAIVALPLPPTSRQHPERQDLGLKAVGDSSVQVSSERAAKRPANWVRKLNALHTALTPALLARDAVLLPGPSPFAPWAQDSDCPASFTSGLRIDLHFAREADFGRLHAAVRMVLPLLPALSASTPFRDGRATGFHSTRLRACIDLYDRHPERVGAFVPEPVFDPADHDREVLGPITRSTSTGKRGEAPDAQTLNLRCATAHLDQGIISIHGFDAQENPAADMAVTEFTSAVLRALVAGRWSSNYLQRAWSSEDLMSVMQATIRDGSRATIANRDYLFMLGMLKQDRVPAGELLKHLFVELYSELSENARGHVGVIIEQGCLAARMLARVGKRPGAERIRNVCAQLAACRTAGPFV